MSSWDPDNMLLSPTVNTCHMGDDVKALSTHEVRLFDLIRRPEVKSFLRFVSTNNGFYCSKAMVTHLSRLPIGTAIRQLISAGLLEVDVVPDGFDQYSCHLTRKGVGIIDGTLVPPFRLMLVEDRPEDVSLVRMILNEAALRVQMTVLSDGEKAIRYVEGWSDVNRPDLIMLDLNLPKINGQRVLEHIRSRDNRTSVAIFSGSSWPNEMRRTRELKADCYIVKPMGLREIRRTATRLRSLVIQILGRNMELAVEC